MEPIKFDGVNAVIGENQPEYTPLPAECVGKPETGQVNTCWELSPEEIKRIQETGKIWLSVLTFGHSFHPVLLTADKPGIYDPE